MITDGQARRIAAEWHGGQASMLCSLATSGFIGEDTGAEVQREIDYLHQTNRDLQRQPYARQSLRDLTALLEYLQKHGLRGRQPGWSDLWDVTPVR